jgi:hypothetical protein
MQIRPRAFRRLVNSESRIQPKAADFSLRNVELSVPVSTNRWLQPHRRTAARAVAECPLETGAEPQFGPFSRI